MIAGEQRKIAHYDSHASGHRTPRGMGTRGEAALNQVIPVVHDELRRLARRGMRGERVGDSLHATRREEGGAVRRLPMIVE